MSLFAHPLVTRLAGIVIGLVFVVAGLAKIGDPAAFAAQIHNFRMMPIPLENLVAMTLPWIELVAGVALILGIRERAAAALLLFLMAFFTIAVAQAVARGLSFECGCFGKADSSTVGLKKIGENIALTAVAWLATRRPSTPTAR